LKFFKHITCAPRPVVTMVFDVRLVPVIGNLYNVLNARLDNNSFRAADTLRCMLLSELCAAPSAPIGPARPYVLPSYWLVFASHSPFPS
jgi:hypothetical protein